MNIKEAYKKGLVMFKNEDDLSNLKIKLGRFPTYEEAAYLLERVVTEEELRAVSEHMPLLETKTIEDTWTFYVYAGIVYKNMREVMDKTTNLKRRMTYEEIRPYVAGIARVTLQYNLYEGEQHG